LGRKRGLSRSLLLSEKYVLEHGQNEVYPGFSRRK
jgi:hypothetical protein